MDVLVFSPNAAYCTEVLRAIMNYGLKERFQFLDVTKHHQNLPDYIKSVPTIVTNDRRVLVDQDVWKYVQFLHGSRRSVEAPIGSSRAGPSAQATAPQTFEPEPSALCSGASDFFTNWESNNTLATSEEPVQWMSSYAAYTDGISGGISHNSNPPPAAQDVSKPSNTLDAALEAYTNQRLRDVEAFSPPRPTDGRGVRAMQST
jgi:hypothetical protein